KLVPAEVYFGRASWEPMRMGSEVSLLSFGSGLLVGMRITLSMGIGMVLAWLIAPGPLLDAGVVPAATYRDVLRWVMWPATGLLVSGGLTALLLKWKLVARTFASLRRATLASDEFPLKWVLVGGAAA